MPTYLKSHEHHLRISQQLILEFQDLWSWKILSALNLPMKIKEKIKNFCSSLMASTMKGMSVPMIVEQKQQGNENHNSPRMKNARWDHITPGIKYISSPLKVCHSTPISCRERMHFVGFDEVWSPLMKRGSLSINGKEARDSAKNLRLEFVF